jgi:hypothetical protein
VAEVIKFFIETTKALVVDSNLKIPWVQGIEIQMEPFMIRFKFFLKNYPQWT